MVAMGNSNTYQVFFGFELNSIDTTQTSVTEKRQFRLLHNAAVRCHQEVLSLFIKTLYGEDEGNTFFSLKRQQIHNWATTCIRLPFWEIKDVNRVHTTRCGEAQNNVMGISDKEFRDFVILRHFLNFTTLATTHLGVVVSKVLTLNKAPTRKRHNHVATRDQITLIEVRVTHRIDRRATFIAIFFANSLEFLTNNRVDTLWASQNVHAVSDVM